MWKSCAVILAVAFLAVFVRVAANTPQSSNATQQGPDIGFDYKKVIDEHIKLISAGKHEAAFDHIVSKSRPGQFDGGSEPMKKLFASIYSGAGKFIGHEVLGYRRLSNRHYRFYVMVDFENCRCPLMFAYYFEKIGGEWKLMGFNSTDKLEEHEKVLPFQPIS